MRALKLAVCAGAAGVLAGGGSYAVFAVPVTRAVAALFAVFGLAACLAPPAAGYEPDLAARVRGAGMVGLAACVAGWIAAAVAGRPDLVGGAAVAGGAAVLAVGVSALARALGAAAAPAAFVGSAAPCLLAGMIFIADPLIETDGSLTSGAPWRAERILAANPLASIAADAGVDWQRERWMYNGPEPGSSGLSVIGRYYPSRPTPPLAWAALTAAAGATVLALARPRNVLPA